MSSKAADILDLKRNGTGLVRVTVLKDISLTLEKLAKNGKFPEIADLPKSESPIIKKPSTTKVKIQGSKSYKTKKRINYDLTNEKKEYNIYIKLASFNSQKNAEVMRDKVSYLEKVKIYKILNSGKTFYQVKAGPFLSVEKVDSLHSMLLEKGMQGAKISIE